MKKSIALLLAVLMIVGLMAGCGGNKEEKTSTEPTASTNNNNSTTTTAPTFEASTGVDELPEIELPLTEDGHQFTYWIPNGSTFEDFSTYDDNLFYQWMEEQTGVDLVFIHPAAGSETEAFQTMILSEDYAAFVQGMKSRYTGGIDKAISDGVVVALNDAVDQWMPHYRAMVYADEETFIQAVSDSGNLWGVHHIVDRPQGAWIGLGVREDLLEKAGLTVESMETIDGFENALVALKQYTYENKGPLWCESGSAYASDGVNASFGVGCTTSGHRFLNIDGEVHYSFTMPGMKEYAAKMADWYAKGLVNSDYVGAASWGTPEAQWTNTEMAVGDFIYTNDLMFAAAAAKSELMPTPDFKLQALTSPKLDASMDWSDLHLRNSQTKIRSGNSMAITTGCDDLELACKFWNYAWTDEGKIRSNWGSVGEYGDVNTISYIDETDANGDGHIYCYQPWTMEKWSNNVTYVQTKCAVHNGPTYSIWSREWCTLNTRQIEYQNIWNRAGDEYVMPDGMTLTKEEGDEASGIVANCDSAATEWLVNVITGVKSADTFETELQPMLNSFNIARAEELYQTAMNRFFDRVQYMGN